ncbi:pyridoxal phosphate-dependent aminotransferase [Xanthovirga aplysinae]|uniref:pyridoxal phosphate-dependent aminotransferase n=1 Tax=Xanthovirga aplysinae TaxID=2529853 RepID=UPI0012BBF7C6|nr:pyridoxal phosphate-dependent aminotransferase [Xanthovirga aplysinae]MTI32582.1 pyridoxal phosphate-dependent aminotransferase [Xanthovirga aplysinae]
MDMLSNRINSLSESATLAMAQKARDYKAKGIDIISLSLGEPDFKTPKHIQEAAKEAIDSGLYFAYPPVPGYQDLREKIAEKLQKDNHIDVKAENVVVSAGAKHTLANIFMALLDPGDEVIVFSPYWVSYAEIIKLAEGTPVFIEGTIENDFKASAAQLEAAITDKTKAVIYSSPCNPTGAVFSREELGAIGEVVKKHPNIMVVADEIYEHINFTGAHASMAAIPGMLEQTVTVNGFAKGYAMTGWRVGYMAGPLWLAKACQKMQGQVTSGICSIAQRAAVTAISGDMAPTKEMAAAYLRRRELVKGLIDEIPGVKANLPQGAFYIFPDISDYFGKSDGEVTINNASDLCLYILDHAHVSTVTGEAFGEPNCIRISFAASDEDLKEALRRIKEVLAKLN